MANDAAAATPKKLQKQAIFADYFRPLTEADLPLAVRYAAGRPFAAGDERVLSVGWSAVSDVILSMLKLDPHDFNQLVVGSGEIGEALSRVWKPGMTGHPLTLHELAAGFDDLAAVGSAEHKRRFLLDLFTRCVHPREAAYLAKIIFREMRSGAREGVLQAAIATAFDQELPRLQRCQLLVGDLGAVAVLAKRNAMQTAQFELFHPIQFMLATPQETAELAAGCLDGRAFFAEDKLDGIRAQIHKSGNRIAIYTRTMDRADGSFPDVVAGIANLPGEFLLDGEIVPYRDRQVLPFAHIQRRLGRKVLSARILRENPAAFIAFDILYSDGQLLLDLPLRQRRTALIELARRAAEQSVTLLTTDATPVATCAEIATAFDAARARRNEGIVLKDPDSPYSPGRRGQWWFKLKTHLPTFDCVVTAAEYGHGKRRDVLSDYTFAVWDREPDLPGAVLVNVGKAYSGVTDAEIAQLTELFLGLSLGQYGRVHLVPPKVVLEIACDQIQRSRRHASGYALRFPRIKRIRWDKRAIDADRLQRVVEVYESTPNFARSITAGPEAPEPTLFD
jgi:DNA ligase 1